jgi:hypothetical protein
MGEVIGYQVAAYLHQHALRVRRTEHLPDEAWHALVRHHHPDDSSRLALSAQRRGRPYEAVNLHRRIGNVDDLDFISRFTWVVAEAGRTESAWDEEALTLLRSLADAGSEVATRRLADLLIDLGRGDEALTPLRPLALTLVQADDEHGVFEVAKLLAKLGRRHEALELVRP